jgi:hypothetical protein
MIRYNFINFLLQSQFLFWIVLNYILGIYRLLFVKGRIEDKRLSAEELEQLLQVD